MGLLRRWLLGPAYGQVRVAKTTPPRFRPDPALVGNLENNRRELAEDIAYVRGQM